MEIRIAKGRNEDHLLITRADGSSVRTRFPHKGPVPHDAVHFFVEQGLGLRNAFWGTIAAGRHPEELAELAKAGGHASARRADVPAPHIVELIQAERLVECFEADLWGGASSVDAVRMLAETACAASQVALPAIDSGAIGKVRAELLDFARVWMAGPIGHESVLHWS